jgi:hypothetical protein
VGGLHAVVGRRLLTISFHPDQAERDGLHIGWWDLLFYLSFGVVLTAIVSIVGVLLVFSYLVIPAVIGRLFSDTISGRLAIGYAVGLLVSVVGVAISYEHSTGPIVVGLLGLCLVLSLGILSVRRAANPAIRGLQLLGGAVTICGTLWAFGQVEGHPEPSHDHVEHAVIDHPHEAHHSDHADHEAEEPSDPLTQLEQGVRMARALDVEGLMLLAQLTRDGPPFIRMEADARLRILAGDAAPSYDPTAAPDSKEVWLTWAMNPGAGWREHAAKLESP